MVQFFKIIDRGTNAEGKEQIDVIWVDADEKDQVEDVQICVVMVGLPARGKSLIARKIVNYLKWLSINAKSFNVGTYRRTETPKPGAEFFDTNNTEGERLRRAAAEAAVNDMLQWFSTGGHVGVLDATNSTKSRRKWIKERCEARGCQVLFVESKCEDDEIIDKNIRSVKVNSPDYKGSDPEEAVRDFMNRIRNYERVYQTIDDDEEKDLTYVKLVDVGTQVVINNIENYLQTRVIYFTMNLHITPRSIWLSRHGESMFNVSGQIGGDADLSPRGMMYAEKLPDLVSKIVPEGTKLKLWTSTMKRTIQTAQFLPYEKKEWKALDELDAGVCDGLTYPQIEAKYPADFKSRDDDKYNYRYRGGESYRDVVIRLEPIIMEMEREDNIMIVTHQAVLRCIYAYFMNIPQHRSPWMAIPLHTVIKLTPGAYGTEMEMFNAGIPAVSTYREKYGSAEMGECEGAASADLSMLADTAKTSQDPDPVTTGTATIEKLEKAAPEAAAKLGAIGETVEGMERKFEQGMETIEGKVKEQKEVIEEAVLKRRRSLEVRGKKDTDGDTLLKE